MTAAERRRLQHMLEYAQAAIRYLGASTDHELEADDEKLSAVLWRICIVGEAAAALIESGFVEASMLPLREARRMRNLIVHEYIEIEVETVAQTVRDDFPSLITQLERLLRTPE